MKATFLNIMEKGNKEELISFLQSLTKEQKEELVPIIEERDKYYRQNVHENKEIRPRMKLLKFPVFICFPYKKMKDKTHWDIPSSEDLNTILPWYCPSWFSDFINERGMNEYWEFTYDQLIGWTVKGYLSPSTALIIEWLPYTVVSSRRGERKYQTKGLTKYPVTYQEHIWLLFRNPSQMHKVNSFYTDHAGKNGNSWEKALKQLVEEGKIERRKVLEESLAAITPQSNKHQAGFFAGLFAAFLPTAEELLKYQDQLHELLSCNHSKPVSISLQHIRQICTHPGFNTRQYVDILPVLLNKDGKAIILAALDITGQIMKKNKQYIPEILSALPMAFLNKDEAVQKSATRLLTEFGEPTEQLCSDMQQVEATILMSIRPLLKVYLPKDQPTPQPEQIKETPTTVRNQLSEEAKIPPIETLEDLAFHLNRTFELKNPADFDHALNELIKWTGQINEENLVLFEPVLKKAYKRYIEHRNETNILYVYAVCLIRYGEYLQQQYPTSLSFLNKLKEKALETSEKFSNYQYINKFISFEPLNIIPVGNSSTEVFLELAIYVLDKIKKGEQLPLLSTPTHYPGWIDPVVLIERLSLYQQQNIPVNELDVQLAIQRCALDQTSEATGLVPGKLTGEWARLMNYLLQPEGKPEGPFNLLSCWVTAGFIRKGKLQDEWLESIYKRIPAEYLSGIHPIELTTTGWGRNRPKISFAKETHNPEKEPARLFMEYNDRLILSAVTATMILSNPNRPGNMYRNVLEVVTRYGELGWEVEEVKTMLAALQLLRELKNPYQKMEYLMLAVSLLSKNKDVQNLGCQIWIEETEANRIDNERLGRLIGKIEAGEVYPIKRFTDMVNALISQLGPSYIPALHELTEGVLTRLPETPIRSLKKVLEVYRELLLLTGKKANHKAIPQLESWSHESSLKKIVKDLGE